MLQTDRTDRQTGETGQRSDSIGRTVLQTVAQKPRMMAERVYKKWWFELFGTCEWWRVQRVVP